MVATLLFRTCAGHLWIAIFLVLPGSMNSIEFLPLTILRLDSWVRNKAKPSHDLTHTRRTRVFPRCYHVIYDEHMLPFTKDSFYFHDNEVQTALDTNETFH